MLNETWYYSVNLLVLRRVWFPDTIGAGREPDVVLVKAGTLDDADPYTPGLHVFTRSKLGWVEVPAAAPQLPENPG